MNQFFVYMLANHKCGTVCIGVTSNLIKRMYEYQNDLVEGFSKKYQTHRLVWFEPHENAESAIMREKQLKKWNRTWKIRLIEKENPNWTDLSSSLLG